MDRRVEFHELFDCDVREAAAWYDRRSPALGDAFVVAVKSTVSSVIEDPTRFTRFAGEARYAKLSRFPYVVLFEPTADALYIAAVLHTARDPSKWRRRFS